MTVGLDNHGPTTLQQYQVNSPNLTIVAPKILDFQCAPRKDAFSIKNIETLLLQGKESLERIKVNQALSWLKWSY